MVTTVAEFCNALLMKLNDIKLVDNYCDFAVRAESYVCYHELKKLINSHINLREKPNQSNLEVFLRFLNERWTEDKFQKANGHYLAKCYNSTANKCCIILAECLSSLVHKHPYALLMPTLPLFGATIFDEICKLKLHEFVLGDQGQPIDIRKCLDVAFENNTLEFLDPYTKKKLTESEKARVSNHSLQAFYYYDLIHFRSKRLLVDDHTTQYYFYDALKSDEYQVRYQYPNSDEYLLKRCFKKMSKQQFFSMLSGAFDPKEWNDFFMLINKNKLQLPNDLQKNLLNEVQNDLNYVNHENYVKAVFFTWTQIYWEKRQQYGETKSTSAWFSNQTEKWIGGKWLFDQTKYYFGGISYEVKKQAVQVFLEFLTQDQFPLGELDAYLQYVDKECCRTALLDHELGMIVNKALEIADRYQFKTSTSFKKHVDRFH